MEITRVGGTSRNWVFSRCWDTCLLPSPLNLLSRSPAIGLGWELSLRDGGDNLGTAVSLPQARRMLNVSLIGCAGVSKSSLRLRRR
ncbi:hypothetical protein CPAR01_06522 [Colletotrichum paranaense]|uniref:Uncharacterized protein n=1 Tax=Colletotrichum paranaense TaxID=1914294 RepID=A0ABQ9SM65_9PEZI|nr:uncharacterized protein CPAR01_06522 [Colletotrichum paranaense]KAK1540533.1 hypothetical protein CPAR01_06522 [Colletotrichum paranaense]